MDVRSPDLTKEEEEEVVVVALLIGGWRSWSWRVPLSIMELEESSGGEE